jgi:hypothetical protein
MWGLGDRIVSLEEWVYDFFSSQKAVLGETASSSSWSHPLCLPRCMYTQSVALGLDFCVHCHFSNPDLIQLLRPPTPQHFGIPSRQKRYSHWLVCVLSQKEQKKLSFSTHHISYWHSTVRDEVSWGMWTSPRSECQHIVLSTCSRVRWVLVGVSVSRNYSGAGGGEGQADDCPGHLSTHRLTYMWGTVEHDSSRGSRGRGV